MAVMTSGAGRSVPLNQAVPVKADGRREETLHSTEARAIEGELLSIPVRGPGEVLEQLVILAEMGHQVQRGREILEVLAAIEDVGADQRWKGVCRRLKPGRLLANPRVERGHQTDQRRTEAVASAAVRHQLALLFQQRMRIVVERRREPILARQGLQPAGAMVDAQLGRHVDDAPRDLLGIALESGPQVESHPARAGQQLRGRDRLGNVGEPLHELIDELGGNSSFQVRMSSHLFPSALGCD